MKTFSKEKKLNKIQVFIEYFLFVYQLNHMLKNLESKLKSKLKLYFLSTKQWKFRQTLRLKTFLQMQKASDK